jgi:acetyl-CoA carboxylase biotin carboxyl carrier protein
MVREHALVEFELEQDGMRLRIRKDSIHAPVAATSVVTPAVVASVAPMMAPAVAPVAMPAAVAATPALAEPEEATKEAIELAVVKSPIVGTFYHAPTPGAPPFVEVGSVVKKGQVLCIIEAMKLMNEIESEYDGEIVKVYVENGHPVQYGERLFAIEPR